MRFAWNLFIVAGIIALLLVLTLPRDAYSQPPPCNGTLQRSLCEAIRRHTTHPEWANSRSLAVLVQHESGGILCAVNPGKINCAYTGKRACGLFQLNPCRCFPDVVRQARCGIRYIESRYRSPELALEFWNRNGSY